MPLKVRHQVMSLTYSTVQAVIIIVRWMSSKLANLGTQIIDQSLFTKQAWVAKNLSRTRVRV